MVLAMKNKKGYVLTDDGRLEHRVIYEERYGKIRNGWVVHHIDCNKRNNHINNLIALPEKFHNTMHTWMERNDKILNRKEINDKLLKFAKRYREYFYT